MSTKEENAYFVVRANGADAGAIVDGPFNRATAAVKRKNRADRKSDWHDHKVVNDPEHPRAQQ